ncbi:uncharacterized protein LOC135821090 isoform X2 [Sycon ciliatum]|uniref:uncharacterized protein LOC135821090 isoform X2 n=1 Tax=Sycon ciliatum TaxID=27933 RepID=UPI0031F62037
MHPSSNRMVFPMLGRIPPRAKLLFSLLLVVLAIDTCNAECPKGKHQSGNATSPCVPLKTICPGTDKAMYSWMALAGLPVHPHANEPSLTEKANLRQARRLCQRRGYDVIDYSAFTNRTKGVRGCMEALLQKMMASTYGSTIIVWTSHVYRGDHVLFKQDKNNHSEAVFDRAGTTLNDVICEAKWIHAFSSAYVAATPASRRAVTQPFAREACQQYGLNFITVDWLQAHGHVFRERWLQRLPIEHNPHHGTKPFHVEPISADGEHHYRTVTFSSGSHTIHNAPSDEQARILCVKFCENKGVVAANMSCVCNRTTSYGERCEKACDCLNQGHCDDTGKCICPKEFTGNKCQSVVCTNPWVKKNKECECKPRLDGPKCTEVCHCLNHGKCAEDGTCVCQKGFHGDLCQQTFKTKCLGTDNATYTWMALASLPCHPDLDGDSCQKKTNLTHARQMCKRRGYDVVEFHAFTNRSMNVRDCMEALLNEMMESSFKSPITIWTSFLRELRDSTKMHVLYKQGKNGLREEVHDRTGAGHHDVICEAKWLHDNNSAYTVATPASRRIVTEPFAEEACQQYGLQLVTEDWLRAHGDVLRERGLERLALKHERDQAAYHVKAIRVNGGSLYRTVTFSENNQEFHHTRSNDRAQILCVACDCLNQGHCDDKGKCICPKEFTGNKCQSVVCTNPWVKKNKECECKPRLDGPKCTEVCHCLNHGKCAEDGTCVCQKGFHGDLCQQTLKTICPGTDKAMYSWMALAGLPVHPHANEPSLTEKANLTQARRLCQRRGYDVIEYSAFINPTKGVRGCMEALLRKMMASTYGSTITVWTSYVHRGDHVLYKQDKNNHRQAVFDRAGTTLNDVICEAKWLHANNSAYTAATPASRRIVTEPFAEEACQQYGLQLVTEDWLRAHGDVLRERGLERLALKHERDQAAYHVKAIRVDGDSLYRTVTFSENNQEFHHTRSNDRAQILCVACNCLNQGHCDDKGKCICPKEFTGNKCQSACNCLNQGHCDDKGKCICPKEFTGNKCQLVVCTNPWVKKNKECECKPRLDGPNCTEVCHCLNHGKCAEDGTCVCQKGFHGDLCQQTFKTKCLGTDNATYTWMALASLPCHPHLDGDSCQKKTNLTHARQMCKRRGYDVVEFHAFISWALNVRDCMEALLNEMMESSFKSPITIWTSFLRELRDATKTHLLYKQGKNGLREEVHDRTGAGHHDVICEAKWLHANNSAYTAATPASRRIVTEPFAEEACQQYGLHLITEDWLRAHGHVLRERGLERLALKHEHDQAAYHVKAIRVDGDSLYRTVTFSENNQDFHRTRSNDRAQILCVRCKCLNQGQCDDKGKCTCPKEFTGNKCQTDFDECASTAHNCDSSAACINTLGSFSCACNDGFYGNGISCQGCNFHELNIASVNRTTGQVTCATGYTRVEGNSVATCPKNSATGNWEGVGNCRALCSEPAAITNGVVNPGIQVAVSDSSEKFYSSAVYKCNQGYRLSTGTSNVLSCSVSGDVADFGSIPACQACTVDGSGHNIASVSASGTVTCNDGHYHNGSLPVCQDAFVSWQNIGSCQAVCTHPWVKKNKECECKPKLDGPTCIEVCNCLNHGQCTEDGTCICRKGFHGDQCQHTKWLHANDSVYAAATPALRPRVTERFAEDACQEHGFHLITKDWLQEHGHVLTERWLGTLALLHKHKQAPYHVASIRANGSSLHRTVTFSAQKQTFQNATKKTQAQILCVKTCETGFLGPNLSCVCNRTSTYGQYCEKACKCLNQGRCDNKGECSCPKGFTGDKCQLVVCTHPWVKKNKVCECTARLDGPNCTEACKCLNDGQCTENGTCICRKGFHGDQCQHTCKCLNDGQCTENGTCICRKGFHGDQCQHTFKTKCLGTDKAMYTWMALAGLPCHPHLDGDSCQKKTNLTRARQMCKRRGYDVVDYNAFTSQTLGVRDCMEELLNKMMASNFNSPITIWTSFLRAGKHVMYKKGKNNLREELHDSSGSSEMMASGHSNPISLSSGQELVKNKLHDSSGASHLDGEMMASGDSNPIILSSGQELVKNKLHDSSGASHLDGEMMASGDSNPIFLSSGQELVKNKLRKELHDSSGASHLEMMASGDSNPISISASLEEDDQNIIYQQGKNELREELYDSNGASHHDVICEAKWLHANDSVYAAATPALRPRVTERFAEDACQEYGFHLITKDWLQEHGHVLTERWLGTLALLHKHKQAPYHVASIRANGSSLHRTVTFSAQKQTFQNATKKTQAQILCVKTCETGFLGPNLSCVCNRTSTYGQYCEKACTCLNQGQCDNKGECSCPKGFTGDKCQLIVCTHPWVKKNKVCECTARLDGPNCTEACKCLNDGQCTENGTCICRKGFHGDQCQHTFKTKCLGTDKAMYTWMALAGLPCHPHLDGDSCQKKTNLTHARQMCKRRGYDVVDYNAFTSQTLGVRDCMEELLNKMMASNFNSPITIWTSFLRDGKHVMYKEGKNNLREELHDSSGSSEMMASGHSNPISLSSGQELVKNKLHDSSGASHLDGEMMASGDSNPIILSSGQELVKNKLHDSSGASHLDGEMMASGDSNPIFLSSGQELVKNKLRKELHDSSGASHLEMMASGDSNPISISASLEEDDQNIIYQQGKNELREELYDSNGASHHDVICEAKWLHVNSSVYTTATPALRPYVTEQFAEEACEQYGLHLVTGAWLQAHGHVLIRERFLERLAIRQAPYHVKPIVVNGNSLYRTVTFSEGKQRFVNTTSNHRAQILCVMCKCLNQGQCDDKGKCICPKGFTGDNCQKVVCTHPWVKKNKVCECKARLGETNCTEACNCLNNGQCTEDGTCLCPTGFRGDQCQDTFRTKSLGTDKVMYTWTALAGLPCYSGSCPKITSWTKARDACGDRGYQLVDFKTFTWLGSKLGVRYRVKSLLHEIMASTNSSAITIWTSSEYYRRRIIYKQYKNKSSDTIFSVHGSGHHNVICEGKWRHINDSQYAAATIPQYHCISWQYAENACQQYGLRLITKDWLQEHGHVLRERWLEKLALNKSDGLGYHVAPILVNGQSLYRTVKFSRQHVTFKNETSQENAKILCVKSCGSGVLAPDMRCVCNRTMSYGEECEKACKCLNRGECDDKGECSCPRGFTGRHCQLVVCAKPWVKKSKVCECQPGLDGRNCTEACNCLNDGQCTDDGSCNCQNGFHGDQCQHIFKTKCLGTDNATYTWMALASLPCHPHLDGDSCQKKTNLTHARQMCKRRGYDVVDHNAFTNQTLGVRDCMGALLNKIVTSGYRNPTSIWTSFKKDDQHLIYQQGKNKLPKELYDSDGTSHHDVICEAKWLRYNDSVYAAATPSLKPSVTEQFAEEACQEYGLHLITKDWLHAHGHVLRKRWLDRLALRHASYHVKRIRVNGNSHYRTVTFRNHSNQLQNSTINRHAKILCVKHCANGVLAQDLSCKCNRSVFYGEYCEKDDCKCLNQGQCDNNGKCTCPIRFYGEHCQLECKTCLNQGRCNEDGTCTCAEGWIGDRCQTRCADTDPCCVNKRIVTRRDHVCRAATSDCDVAEYCDGETATCPEDLTARNGWPCSNSQAYCWSGVCQSRTGQCQSVWNDMDQGSAPEDCFTIMNMDGDRIGNCGFKSSNSTPGTYAACAAGDSLCGSLFCLPVARKIQPSSDVLAETIRVPDVGKCNGLYASPPRSHDDPSLVKDGTRCDASGANKDLVCHKQRCVDKSRVTSQCSVDADSGKECGEVGVCTNATTCLYPPTPEINESSTGSANTTQAATPTTSGITKPTSDPATTTPTEVGDEQWSGL